MRSTRQRLVGAAATVVLLATIVAACIPRAPVPDPPLAILPWTPHDTRRGMEAGASAYLAKPYSPRELMALIRQLAPEETTA